MSDPGFSKIFVTGQQNVSIGREGRAENRKILLIPQRGNINHVFFWIPVPVMINKVLNTVTPGYQKASGLLWYNLNIIGSSQELTAVYRDVVRRGDHE